jgi:hypothetical protein
MRFLAGLGALVGTVVFLLVFALVNGGYIYRVQCPRGGGTTETEWTYRWQSVLPYVGYSRSGCRTHTATALALDAIGVRSIDDESSRTPGADHSSEYDPQSVRQAVDSCVAQGESRPFCECAIDEFTRRLSPAEFDRLARAMRSGAETFDDLPSDLGEKTQDASAAARRDCP